MYFAKLKKGGSRDRAKTVEKLINSGGKLKSSDNFLLYPHLRTYIYPVHHVCSIGVFLFYRGVPN